LPGPLPWNLCDRSRNASLGVIWRKTQRNGKYHIIMLWHMFFMRLNKYKWKDQISRYYHPDRNSWYKNCTYQMSKDLVHMGTSDLFFLMKIIFFSFKKIWK
jgi:hypothetical protein